MPDKPRSLSRCAWAKGPLYEEYHDHEWGRPVHDDRTHFEFLLLEGAQAGLSWITVLKKREAYRRLFADFDPVRVARFTDAKLEKILLDPGIIRNRLKVFAARHNARLFLEIQKEFGSFDRYIWSFTGHKVIDTSRDTVKDLPARTKESDALSKDLYKRGFKFVGSVIMYSHMQACGLVNDHVKDCFTRQSARSPSVKKTAKRFR
jgi:DNA-3-methyladenine glycosylase I